MSLTYVSLFPSTIAKQPKNSDLLNQCEIRSLFIAINLTTDPTSKVEEVLTGISSRDLFSFGSLEQSLVGSIDFTYRNVWNEIRTLHFEGQNAILLALKVLSTKFIVELIAQIPSKSIVIVNVIAKIYGN